MEGASSILKILMQLSPHAVANRFRNCQENGEEILASRKLGSKMLEKRLNAFANQLFPNYNRRVEASRYKIPSTM
uniref:Uncharacterized protein n=1 Tax=Romanomermis culicivorax TaxID=13658 RepID=A0A915J039_ROMCU